MVRFEELALPDFPSVAEVKGEIKSVSKDIPLKRGISIHHLLSAAHEPCRLTAPSIRGQTEASRKRYSKCIERFCSKASLLYAFMGDPAISHSLMKLALQAINEREQSVPKLGCIERDITQEEEDTQEKNGKTDHLPVIEHLAFHPAAPILALSTSLSTIHLYNLESEAFATYFLSPASINGIDDYPKITTLQFSKDDMLAAGLSNGIVDLWTLRMGQLRQKEVSNHCRYSLFIPPHLSPERLARRGGSSSQAPTSAWSAPKPLSSLLRERSSLAAVKPLVGPERVAVEKSTACKSISLVSQSPYLEQSFLPQEILGKITCLSFSPSGRHLAIGTEQAGLWHYNIILKSTTNILPGPLNIKCLSWGPPLSTRTAPSGPEYRPPPDITHLVAGLADGGGAYFKVSECGVALRFTGGSISLTAPIPQIHAAFKSRKTASLNICHILVASAFSGWYGPGFFVSPPETPYEQDPLIFLSRLGTKELQIYRVTPFVPPPPVPRNLEDTRKSGKKFTWHYIWSIICDYFCVYFSMFLNTISKAMELRLVSDGTCFRAECIGCVDVSYIDHSGGSPTPLTPLTCATTTVPSELEQLLPLQSDANEDALNRRVPIEMDTPRSLSEFTNNNTPLYTSGSSLDVGDEDGRVSSDQVGVSVSKPMEPMYTLSQNTSNLQIPGTRSTHIPLLRTDRLQTRQEDGPDCTISPNGYGGEVVSMAMDKEGRRLIVRFDHYGKTSAVIFDTRGAYHLPRLELAHETGPKQLENDGTKETDSTCRNEPMSLYDLGQKLLRPLGVLTPQPPIAETMETVGPVNGRSVLEALRLFGSSEVKKHLQGTLLEPYIDGILRRMHQEEDEENLKASQRAENGKGKGKERIADEGLTEMINNELLPAVSRGGSRHDTWIGDVGVTSCEHGGTIGMILGDHRVHAGGDRVGFVAGVWT